MNSDDLDALATALDRLHRSVVHLVADGGPRIDAMASDASSVTAIIERIRFSLNRLDAEEQTLQLLARHASRIVDDLAAITPPRDDDRGLR